MWRVTKKKVIKESHGVERKQVERIMVAQAVSYGSKVVVIKKTEDKSGKLLKLILSLNNFAALHEV